MAGEGRPFRVLFTGYAPVHYACFRPLHERLERLEGVEVSVSGGLRTKTEGAGYLYDAPGMYGAFDLASRAVLDVDEIRECEFDLLICANTRKIEPGAFSRSVEIFHGMSFRNRAVREANASHDHYFLLGPYMRRAFEQRGLLEPDDARAASIGFMKTDRLLDGSLSRAEILRREGLAGDRPLVLYAPTGAKHNSLETMGEQVLRRLKATDEYDVLVKLHDHPKNKVDWHARLAPLEDDHLRVARTPDVVESLYVADLLVSDASSVSNEYALLDRPMVFLDVPELMAANAGEGSSLDLETWGRRAGAVAEDPESAVRAVVEGFEHPEQRAEVRRGIVEDLFYNPGRATDAAEAWVRDELAL